MRNIVQGLDHFFKQLDINIDDHDTYVFECVDRLDRTHHSEHLLTIGTIDADRMCSYQNRRDTALEDFFLPFRQSFFRIKLIQFWFSVMKNSIVMIRQVYGGDVLLHIG
ncbi:hypothetical protein D3C73_1261390 [compost metagenome]